MWLEIFLVCFWVGVLWSVASLLLGGMHLGHSGGHGHAGHAHAGGHAHAHGPAKLANGHASNSALLGWLGAMANPSCIAVYLAWFGGIGYLLMRHTGLAFWANLVIAIATGLAGAWLLAAFLRFLQSSEQPLNAADYEIVGTLGRVSCSIRPDGVGEVIYIRDGARRPLPARTDDGRAIGRDEEVIVTRFEKGIAYVRTWDAMTQPAEVAKALAGANTLDSRDEFASRVRAVAKPVREEPPEKTLQKETKNVVG